MYFFSVKVTVTNFYSRADLKAHITKPHPQQHHRASRFYEPIRDDLDDSEDTSNSMADSAAVEVTIKVDEVTVEATIEHSSPTTLLERIQCKALYHIAGMPAARISKALGLSQRHVRYAVSAAASPSCGNCGRKALINDGLRDVLQAAIQTPRRSKRYMSAQQLQAHIPELTSFSEVAVSTALARLDACRLIEPYRFDLS